MVAVISRNKEVLISLTYFRVIFSIVATRKALTGRDRDSSINIDGHNEFVRCQRESVVTETFQNNLRN
jgi:hypothetical protein